MTLTKEEVQARIAKMIPGGLLLEFMSYEHMVELMTVTQIITNLCLNEIEKRGELTEHDGYPNILRGSRNLLNGRPRKHSGLPLSDGFAGYWI